MDGSTRWLAGVGALVALAVVAALVVGALAEGEQDFAAGTPEHTVQSYLRAVSDRDATEAFTYLAPSLVASCGEFPRDAVTQRGDYRFRATLVETIERAQDVEVRVDLTERYGEPPFDGGESTYEQTFVLSRQDDGGWLISETPWPLYCPRPAPITPAVPAPARG